MAVLLISGEETMIVGCPCFPKRFREVHLLLKGIFGETWALEGIRAASSALRLELPPLGIAVFEVEVADVGPEKGK